MDMELLVDDQIEDGRKLIARLIGDSFDVTVAFWAKTSEDGSWFLYIGSATVTSGNIGGEYQRAYDSLVRIQDASITISEIKLVAVTNPIARDAIAVRDRHPARIPIQYRGKRLGNLSIEEAYIYPRATGGMTPDEVLQTVLGLINRHGTLQPSIVTLRNGSTMRAIPTGIQGPPAGTVRIAMIDVDNNTNIDVRPDDVVNIQ